MDILRSLPTRASFSQEEDEDSVNIEEEEEEAPRAQKRRKYNLGLNLQDDYFEIPQIKQKRLPREDGLEWEFWELTEAAERKRPYGKRYLEDEEQRQKILSNNKDYRFASELAGALRKELSDIVEPEDMARLIREQELERAQTDIELKRTRVDMDTKYELIQKLKRMAEEQRRDVESQRARQAPLLLRSQAKYLVDSDDGFLGLLQLYKSYANTPEYLQERDRLVSEVLGIRHAEEEEEEPLSRDLFYALFLYYRDFLNNESVYTLRDAIRRRLHYLLSQQQQQPLVVKKEEEAEQVDDAYEGQLRQLGVSDDENALRQLRLFYESIVLPPQPIDWSLYKARRTESIHMGYFEALGISRSLEAQMARLGASSRYAEDYPVYLKQVLAYLYGTPEERENSLKGKLTGLNLLSDDVEDVGHPSDISELIKVQFPTYKDDGPLEAIELLLRSHFLWLFFEEIEWPAKILLLKKEESTILANIRRLTERLERVLLPAVNVYKSLLMDYLREIGRVLADNEPPAIVLTPQQRSTLFGESEQLEAEAERFDRLNLLFKDTEVADLVQDSRFYESLRKEASPNIVTPTEAPVLILHRLFTAYQDYLGESLTNSTNNLARIESAIEKATRKIAEVVGDESYTLNPRDEYRQRKAFTTRPENSGFVKLRSEIRHLLNKAFHFVNDYAVSLRGLPLEAYQTDNAYEVGLSTDFISFVAVLAADLELTFPDAYRSQRYYTKIKEDKQATMARLRRYSYHGGRYGQPYVVRKDVSMTPCFVEQRDVLSRFIF